MQNMLSALLLIKFATAVTVVIGLSLLAEHASPRLAGILSGAPTGTALTLFFLAVDISPEFAANSAISNIKGLLGALCFVYSYYIASLYLSKISVNKILIVSLSSLSAILTYFTIAYLLQFLSFSRYINAALVLAAIPIFLKLLNGIEDCSITQKVKSSYWGFLLRGSIAAGIIAFITSIAMNVGPSWAGLLSAFPSTFFPLLLIMHSTYDTKIVHALLKKVPIGLSSLVLYSLTVSLIYPLWGTYIGTAFALTIAAVYLIAYEGFKSR